MILYTSVLRCKQCDYHFLGAATHQVYKRAIVQAIDELQDFNLRSNIDSIRRHVQSNLRPESHWNDAVFLMTMKSLAQAGDIEWVTSVNCALTPDFKKRRTQSCNAMMEKRSQRRSLEGSSGSVVPSVEYHSIEFPAKEPPAKKTEHTKLKIIPKKIYDNLQ